MASRFSDYFNRFTTAKQWEKLIFRASHGGLQSAELNEMQDVLSKRINDLGRGIYQDGHVVEGADCFILPEMASPSVPPAANIRISAGRIALRGTVYDVPETTLLIANDKLVWVGIRFRTTEQDEFDDPDLLNPAEGTRGYQEPGAGRLRAEWMWGWKADDDTEDANDDWDFYPVFEIDDGVIVIRAVPPNADPLLNLIAKYDREAHGNYVVRGFETTFVNLLAAADAPFTTPTDQYTFNIASGLADIQGYKTERHPATRMLWDRDPTLVAITGEPHHYDGSTVVIGHPPPTPPPPTTLPDAPWTPPPGGVPTAGGRETILLNRSPIVNVTRILATLFKRGGTTHNIAGGMDTIDSESNPIGTILSVKLAASPYTEYTKGVDWKQTGDKIDWSLTPAVPPGHAEPTGLTLEVGYTYTIDLLTLGGGTGFDDNKNLVSIDVSSVTVQGLYPDSYIYVDYSWAVPRKDLIVLNVEGQIDRIKGVSQIRNPTAPKPSEDQVALATVEYDWITDPKVVEVSPRTIPMTELHTMRNHIFDLYELVAIVALRGDQGLRGEAERLGVFVDPFISENIRDYGIYQKLVSGNGSLQLPVPSLPYEPDGTAEDYYWTLPFTLEELAVQPAKTGCLQITPTFVPPVIVIPPPPPVPHTPRFSLTGAGGSGNRTNAIQDAIENPMIGLRWFMNSNRAHYSPPLDAITKADCTTIMNTIKAADLTAPGTYWGDHTPGVPNANHNRTGSITIGAKTYDWFTRITELIFTNPPLNLHHWFGNWPAPLPQQIYEVQGAIPSDASINAIIASTVPQLRAANETLIDAWAAWSADTKTQLKAQLLFFAAPALLKDQTRHAQWAINNNVYHAWLSAQFQPNYRYVIPVVTNPPIWIHRLTVAFYGCGPRDELEPNVSAYWQTTCNIRGVYDVPEELWPPRRHIRVPPPVLPPNVPPVIVPPILEEETFVSDEPLRFNATGFKPTETVDNAVVDGETIPVLPRDDDDGFTTVTEGVDV